jgi:hypothetical protein
VFVQVAAVHILKADTFPDLVLGARKGTPQQQGLGDEDADPATSIEMLGLSQHHDFERLVCEHEEWRDLEGRVHNKAISRLIEKRRFQLFRNRSERSLLFASGQRLAIITRAMKRLAGPDLKIGHDAIDVQRLLKAFKERGATVRAAYFSELKVANVDSASLYGHAVDLSDEYSRLDMQGFLSGIMVEMPVGGAVEKFLVTHRRTVVAYRRLDEKQLLQFGLDVNQLIADALGQPPAR